MSVKTQRLYKSATSNFMEWTSNHWYNVKKQVDNFTEPNNVGEDVDDPQGFGYFQGDKKKGGKENAWIFKGDGTMRMYGVYPRYYITNSNFKNVEMTLYYKRLSVYGKSSDGINVAARSHIHGHKENYEGGKYLADTHTYYGRCRHDGYADIGKEQHHKKTGEYEATYRTWGNGRYRKKKKMFSSDLPTNKWIGWKFVVCTLKKKKPDDPPKVLLQTWIDVDSDGKPEKYNETNWQLVEQVVDEYGKIAGAPSKAYEIFGTDPKSVFDVNGICFIRSGFGDALYKDFDIHEIKPFKQGCQREDRFYEREQNIFIDYLYNIMQMGKYVIGSLTGGSKKSSEPDSSG